MRKEFIVERQGKSFILYAGLLDLAHSEGLRSITTDLIQAPSADNDKVAIVKATIVFEKDGVERVYQGIGDAAPNNVAPAMQTCLIRMAECVPHRAKMLTRMGWKTFHELQLGEDVLAYDLETDTNKWTPLLGVSVYVEPHHTAILSGRSFQTQCTLEHTWATANQNCHRKLVKTQDLTTHAKIVVAARTEDDTDRNSISDRDAAILGWLVTDGSIRETMVGKNGPYIRCTIYQSKPEMVEKLRNLLGADAHINEAESYGRTFPTGKTYQCQKSYKFALTTEFGNALLQRTGFTCYQKLSDVVLCMNGSARKAMLEAMLLADGSKSKASDTWTFAKKNHPGVMEAFEILATLEGYALGSPQVIKSCNMPSRTLRSNRHITYCYLKVLGTVSCPVWCPTTKYGTWVMELDGWITITGNTRAKGRALRDAVNVGVAAFEELGEEGADDGQRGLTRRSARTAAAANTRSVLNTSEIRCSGCGAPPNAPHATKCAELAKQAA